MSSVITQIALGVRTNCTEHIILGQELLTACNPEATATKQVLKQNLCFGDNITESYFK